MRIVCFVGRNGWAAGGQFPGGSMAAAWFNACPSPQHIMLVQRQMSVMEEGLQEFQLALKHYVESASSQSGCLR